MSSVCSHTWFVTSSSRWRKRTLIKWWELKARLQDRTHWISKRDRKPWPSNHASYRLQERSTSLPPTISLYTSKRTMSYLVRLVRDSARGSTAKPLALQRSCFDLKTNSWRCTHSGIRSRPDFKLGVSRSTTKLRSWLVPSSNAKP